MQTPLPHISKIQWHSDQFVVHVSIKHQTIATAIVTRRILDLSTSNCLPYVIATTALNFAITV